MFKKTLLAAGIVGLTAVGASAATVINEPSIGDFNGCTCTANDLGIFSMMTTVNGAVDGGPPGSGNGPDEQDSFKFTVLGATSIDFSGTGAVGSGSLRSGNNAASLGAVPSGTNVFNLVAGTYIFTVVPGGNSGQGSWSATFNTTAAPAIPLPAGLPLMVAGLGGLALVARRKRAA